MPSPRGKEFPFKCCLTAQLSVSATSQEQRSINDSSTLRYDFATAITSSLYPNMQFTNHESLPDLQDSFRSFLKAFPQFLQTVEADQARVKEYPHLSISNHVCLDFIGHGLFSYSQQMGNALAAAAASSVASTSLALPPVYTKLPSFELSYKPAPLNSQMGDGEGQSNFETHVRKRIMRFLNISDEDYSLVFTANHSSAFTVLAESYPYKTNKNIVTVYDHENEAVEALVESSKRRGARAISAEFKWPSLKIHYNKLKEVLINRNKKKGKRGLFVFPLQSRVTGARYSYQWMNVAQENDWHVLLDATALGPKDMDTLGLSLFRPDFLICTCYKVFGLNPYGFGCLFVKKSNASIFNGSIITPSRGIVNLVVSSTLPNQPSNTDEQGDEESDSSAFSGEIRQTGGEHSTTDIDINIQFKGLDTADMLGMVIINSRSRYLINWLINAMLSLQYPSSENSQQLVSIYGPRVRFDRAPILAFNMFDWKGEKVDPILVQKLADRNNISLGCGFVKRIWFGERYEGDKARVLESKKDEKLKEGSKRRENGDECGIAVVTITIGFLNNFEDVYRLWGFVARFLDVDFLEKERWTYTALNQRTVEV
ncbi:hypothetical protein V2J09_014701 [Rumex salicifolius]